MSILHSQNIAVSCCFLIFFTVSLSSITSENSVDQTENSGKLYVTLFMFFPVSIKCNAGYGLTARFDMTFIKKYVILIKYNCK